MKEILFDAHDESTGAEGVLVYRVPDDTVIGEWSAEADAERASLDAGTYPPRFVPQPVTA